MIEYVIVGDTEQFERCLIKTCVGMKLADAEQELLRMLNNPTENDKLLIDGYKNLRLDVANEKGQF